MRWLIAIVLVLAACAPSRAHAQAAPLVLPCSQVTSTVNGIQQHSCVPTSSANPLPVTTNATSGLTSTNLSGSISVSNTFQSIQASTAGRKGCLVQNNGTHTMWVFFGPVASATEATAFQLTAGQVIYCGGGPGTSGVLTDQVSITGTAADTFTANFQ